MNSKQKEYVDKLTKSMDEIKKTIEEVIAASGADYEYGYYSFSKNRKNLYVVITDNDFNFPTEGQTKPIEFYLPKGFKLNPRFDRAECVYDGIMFECEIL